MALRLFSFWLVISPPPISALLVARPQKNDFTAPLAKLKIHHGERISVETYTQIPTKRIDPRFSVFLNVDCYVSCPGFGESKNKTIVNDIFCNFL